MWPKKLCELFALNLYISCTHELHFPLHLKLSRWAWKSLVSSFLMLILCSSLSLQIQTEKRSKSLKEKLASVAPLVEDLKMKREERMNQFSDIKAQIEKISGEISGYSHLDSTAISSLILDEQDLSLRKLTDFQNHLRTLQKEKVMILVIGNDTWFLSYLPRHSYLPLRVGLSSQNSKLCVNRTSHLFKLVLFNNFNRLNYQLRNLSKTLKLRSSSIYSKQLTFVV